MKDCGCVNRVFASGRRRGRCEDILLQRVEGCEERGRDNVIY